MLHQLIHVNLQVKENNWQKMKNTRRQKPQHVKEVRGDLTIITGKRWR